MITYLTEDWRFLSLSFRNPLQNLPHKKMFLLINSFFFSYLILHFFIHPLTFSFTPQFEDYWIWCEQHMLYIENKMFEPKLDHHAPCSYHTDALALNSTYIQNKIFCAQTSPSCTMFAIPAEWSSLEKDICNPRQTTIHHDHCPMQNGLTLKEQYIYTQARPECTMITTQCRMIQL